MYGIGGGHLYWRKNTLLLNFVEKKLTNQLSSLTPVRTVWTSECGREWEWRCVFIAWGRLASIRYRPSAPARKDWTWVVSGRNFQSCGWAREYFLRVEHACPFSPQITAYFLGLSFSGDRSATGSTTVGAYMFGVSIVHCPTRSATFLITYQRLSFSTLKIEIDYNIVPLFELVCTVGSEVVGTSHICSRIVMTGNVYISKCWLNSQP